MNAINPYLKFIAAILGALVTSLAIYYPAAHWIPVVTAVATAINVYITPNVPSVPVMTPKEKSMAIHPSTGIYGTPTEPFEPFSGDKT